MLIGRIFMSEEVIEGFACQAKVSVITVWSPNHSCNVAHRWLIMWIYRQIVMLAHRWLITLVHRWPTVNGSQVAHSRLCISSKMLRSLQRSFQTVIRGSLGSFCRLNVTFTTIVTFCTKVLSFISCRFESFQPRHLGRDPGTSHIKWKCTSHIFSGYP